MNPRCAPTPVRLRRGFTLVEIMVAVVILGILIAIAVPTYKHFQRKGQSTTFVNNLRIFTQAFETFAMKYGAWPPDTGAGLIPQIDATRTMSGEFRDADWTAEELGGHWKWNYSSSSHPRASISIVGVTADSAQMTEIDATIDDGNLSTGNFKGSGTTYTYTVQQ
jgi:prepilin-type N-terminal cleavage/methylation domain-containing protein